MEFDSWEESEEYLKAASAEQLHELALEHLPCWNGEEERCGTSFSRRHGHAWKIHYLV